MGTDRVAYLDLPPDNILAQVHIRQRRGANEMQMGIELCDRGSQRLVRDVLEDGGAEFLVGCGESGGAFDFARRRLAFDRARYPIDFLRPEFLCRDAQDRKSPRLNSSHYCAPRMPYYACNTKNNKSTQQTPHH